MSTDKPESIRIGIHGAPLCGVRSGIGRYVNEICQRLDALLPTSQFFVYAPIAPDVELPSSRWRLRIERGAARLLGGYGWLKFNSPRIIERDELDAFWSTRTLSPRMVRSVGIVSTVYDLNHLIVPESMSPANRLAHSIWFSRDLRRSDRIVAISDGTAARLVAHLGLCAHAVAAPGTDSRFAPRSPTEISAVRAKHGLNGPFLLAVATLEPRKNIGALVDAFTELQASGQLQGYTLALVGARGWSQETLLRRLADGIAGVRGLGFVADDDLPALYSAAELFVMPSLYEGYGMPIAEARACGTRVLATDIPEMRQAGGPHTTYVAADKASLQQGMLESLARAVAPPESRRSWDAAAQVMACALIDAAAVAKDRDRLSRAALAKQL